jgi:tRNA G18 (ribose-2'-O)-methylase SpoU
VGTVECFREEGRRVFAAELRAGAASVEDISFRKSDVLVIGNEGHGIPEAVSVACSGSVYIPIREGVESLNAAVAAAVLMWEARRAENNRKENS